MVCPDSLLTFFVPEPLLPLPQAERVNRAAAAAAVAMIVEIFSGCATVIASLASLI
jgi:hypothetical protein